MGLFSKIGNLLNGKKNEKMEAFFNELRGEIVAAVREDTRKVLKEAGEERIYAAALVTDCDCITLFFAVNTYEKMREKDIKYLDILKNDLTEKIWK